MLNVSDHPVTWEKREVASVFEPVDLATAKDSGKWEPDMSFKKDLLAAVHEEIELAEKALDC